MPHPHLTLILAAAVIISVCAPGRVIADPSTGGAPPVASPEADPAKLSARDAGARYGQALGVIEICHGSKVTDTGNALGQTYTGPDQDAFKAQAAKVYEAWHRVKNCNKALDPNECKIIMDKSCAAAEKEIGPSGTVMPGLVEFMKR